MKQTALPHEDTLPDGRPAIGPDGVDISLIRWMLSLTPAQRLRVLEEQLRSIEELRACRVASVIERALAGAEPNPGDHPPE
jgi:hypothetical protein